MNTEPKNHFMISQVKTISYDGLSSMYNRSKSNENSMMQRSKSQLPSNTTIKNLSNKLEIKNREIKCTKKKMN